MPWQLRDVVWYSVQQATPISTHTPNSRHHRRRHEYTLSLPLPATALTSSSPSSPCVYRSKMSCHERCMGCIVKLIPNYLRLANIVLCLCSVGGIYLIWMLRICEDARNPANSQYEFFGVAIPYTLFCTILWVLGCCYSIFFRHSTYVSTHVHAHASSTMTYSACCTMTCMHERALVAPPPYTVSC